MLVEAYASSRATQARQVEGEKPDYVSENNHVWNAEAWHYLKATCKHIVHCTAENELRSSKPDEGKPPSTRTASSGVVASPGVLANENLGPVGARLK